MSGRLAQTIHCRDDHRLLRDDLGRQCGHRSVFDSTYAESVSGSLRVEEPGCLEVLPDGYRELFHRVLDVADADEYVRAVWLGGSLARGEVDSASDLDVILAVTDESFPRWAEGELGHSSTAMSESSGPEWRRTY